MLAPAKPVHEEERVHALHALNILDTRPEERFDRLTRLARRLFDVPIALVSLVDSDRQWFKSCQGMAATETSRDVSFCAHAILSDQILMVPDAGSDERFHDNPLVTGEPKIRFYAGCPLKVGNGSNVGTLCLLDTRPRVLDAEERGLLLDLASMAEREIAALQLASIDDLTQLSNRRGFEALAEHALSMCRRMGTPASLLFFDLDRFKAINDTFGHAEGDRALVTFAQVLRRVLREMDVIGRMGGDEFVALLLGSNAAAGDAVIDRLSQALAEANAELQGRYTITYSVGRIEYDPGRHDTVKRLLADADGAMYARKQAARRS
ncbi:sensor domain-containing diguanylate cyclase [Pseudomonas sp. CFBP 8770]|uniref:sensor domain-containing diguanylate cyclase n=1 Tax=unclassified Pseudomonas TaxID=196821 RepID=UPI00177E42F3|nr:MULTISPECIES: sensor domain-containing diguanylate cyclase [unclassified Pseudomonas]MBD8473656.1 sensor domain-containing diguanylate cyclase [Pseudomonas sp. CFBP 8773]MBD8646783.1 sensor domain-containing diguanylate cyclase [Pseudomonas sp. CFBP 8770]